MTVVQKLTWIIAVIGFTAFVISYTALILHIDKCEKKLIDNGTRDGEIIKAYTRPKRKGQKAGRIFANVLELAMLAIFAFCAITAIYSAAFSNDFPVFGVQMKVCASNSMSTVHKKTADLVPEDALIGSFSADDLLIIRSLPKESDLKLYDIVSYKDGESGLLIIHRIVKIETTASGTLYTMRGDANYSNDANKISYSDMRGIYGGCIPVMGTFVRFVQSALFMIAGATCVYVCILEELIARNLTKADIGRLKIICPDFYAENVKEKKKKNRAEKPETIDKKKHAKKPESEKKEEPTAKPESPLKEDTQAKPESEKKEEPTATPESPLKEDTQATPESEKKEEPTATPKSPVKKEPTATPKSPVTEEPTVKPKSPVKKKPTATPESEKKEEPQAKPESPLKEETQAKPENRTEKPKPADKKKRKKTKKVKKKARVRTSKNPEKEKSRQGTKKKP